MDFETFQPAYEAILADLGYGRAGDERARDVLVDLDPRGSLAAFEDVLAGRDVAVVAPGPSLGDELEDARTAESVVAVSSAAGALREHDVAVDAYVTDLDADPELAQTLSAAGVPTVVHAHGDNVPAVREVVPECDREHVLGTTQVEPQEPVVNVGGFTDGDRAAFLADHVGARSLSFPGWDLADRDVDPTKRRKLEWAARLLYWLETERRERLDEPVHFEALDGLRENLDVSALPVD